MKRCGACGAEYAGTASKNGAAYRLVRDEYVEYVYECGSCHNNTDSRRYPRTKPDSKKKVRLA